jgi:uncharacterized membrane protein YhaH (DUF805 family)
MSILNTKSGLSTMWVFVMLNMIFADILSAMDASILKQFLAGHADQITITPTFILIAAIATEIPIAMVVASRMLPLNISRWANMGAAVLTVVYIWGGMVAMPHYIFIATVETIACVSIAWGAWGMRQEKTDTEAAVIRPSAATSVPAR